MVRQSSLNASPEDVDVAIAATAAACSSSGNASSADTSFWSNSADSVINDVCTRVSLSCSVKKRGRPRKKRRLTIDQSDISRMMIHYGGGDGNDDDVGALATQPIVGPLKGVIAFVEVYCGRDNCSECFAHKLEELGAKINKGLTAKVTHVIWKDGRQSTLDRAFRQGSKVVTVLWVESCLKLNQHVPEEGFLIMSPAEAAAQGNGTPVIMGKLRKQRSMQPKSIDFELHSSGQKIRQKQRRDEIKKLLEFFAKIIQSPPMNNDNSSADDTIAALLNVEPKPIGSLKYLDDRIKRIMQRDSEELSPERNVPYASMSPSDQRLADSLRKRLLKRASLNGKKNNRSSSHTSLLKKFLDNFDENDDDLDEFLNIYKNTKDGEDDDVDDVGEGCSYEEEVVVTPSLLLADLLSLDDKSGGKKSTGRRSRGIPPNKQKKKQNRSSKNGQNDDQDEEFYSNNKRLLVGDSSGDEGDNDGKVESSVDNRSSPIVTAIGDENQLLSVNDDIIPDSQPHFNTNPRRLLQQQDALEPFATQRPLSKFDGFESASMVPMVINDDIMEVDDNDNDMVNGNNGDNTVIRRGGGDSSNTADSNIESSDNEEDKDDSCSPQATQQFLNTLISENLSKKCSSFSTSSTSNHVEEEEVVLSSTVEPTLNNQEKFSGDARTVMVAVELTNPTQAAMETSSISSGGVLPSLVRVTTARRRRKSFNSGDVESGVGRRRSVRLQAKSNATEATVSINTPTSIDSAAALIKEVSPVEKKGKNSRKSLQPPLTIAKKSNLPEISEKSRRKTMLPQMFIDNNSPISATMITPDLLIKQTVEETAEKLLFKEKIDKTRCTSNPPSPTTTAKKDGRQTQRKRAVLHSRIKILDSPMSTLMSPQSPPPQVKKKQEKQQWHVKKKKKGKKLEGINNKDNKGRHQRRLTYGGGRKVRSSMFVSKTDNGSPINLRDVNRRSSEDFIPRPPIILLTAATKTQRAICEQACLKISDGGRIASEYDECVTHLVFGEPKRTLNFLRALVDGVPLLSVDWVQKSLAAKHWLFDIDKYSIDSKLYPSAPLFRQSSAHVCSLLFADYNPIFVAPGCMHPPAQFLIELILKCGAKLAKLARTAKICIGDSEVSETFATNTISAKQSKKQHQPTLVVNEKWALDAISTGIVPSPERYALKDIYGETEF